MIQVLEAVPNFSEGRDVEAVRALVDEVAAGDVEVLDWSADPDHHRSVVTLIGPPRDVEEASVRGARFAIEHIDLTSHRGVHPRVGALDVMPFVPLEGLAMADAVASAHRVGRAIAELGVPVYFYGRASDPPGRSLVGGASRPCARASPRGAAPTFPRGPPGYTRRPERRASERDPSCWRGTFSCPASTRARRVRSQPISASVVGASPGSAPLASGWRPRIACRSR
jgi:hypothetical protein